MDRLGRKFGRTGGATLGRASLRAILWSIPVCWFIVPVGGGHGFGLLPLPTVPLPFLVDTVLTGGLSGIGDVGTGDATYMILALVSPIVPISFFVVAAREADDHLERVPAIYEVHYTTYYDIGVWRVSIKQAVARPQREPAVVVSGGGFANDDQHLNVPRQKNPQYKTPAPCEPIASRLRKRPQLAFI
jgi:hypothetical protein